MPSDNLIRKDFVNQTELLKHIEEMCQKDPDYLEKFFLDIPDNVFPIRPLK